MLDLESPVSDWGARGEQYRDKSAPESVAGAGSLGERAHLPGVDAYCSSADGFWGSYRAPSLLDTAPDTPDRSELEVGFTFHPSRSAGSVVLDIPLLYHSQRHRRGYL